MSAAADRRKQILDGIARAAALAKRDHADVRLIAVSKGRATEDIAELIAAGQHDFGENRMQEALTKWPALLARYPDVRLHGIGRLQSNKAPEAVKLFDVIHALDRRSLLDALVKAAAKAGRTPSLYVQVNIGEEEQKGGCPIGEVGVLVSAVRESSLPLAGLMAIPPAAESAEHTRPHFRRLRELRDELGFEHCSMGMSADYEVAIEEGATMVRVGTAIFGPRTASPGSHA
jgi:hypothetical protein